MHLHIIEHAPFESPGRIESWAGESGATIGFTRTWKGDAFPAKGSFDGLVIMGGPMSVNDTKEHPWLVDEISIVGEAIDAGHHVLGVCLGAQIVAAACGARVRSGPVSEIGWYPVLPTIAGSQHPAFEPYGAGLIAFHWHRETFDLPESAELLATSEAFGHQAFRVGRRALALQFHLEMDMNGINSILEACATELDGSKWVSDERAIRAGAERHMDSAHAALDRILSGHFGGAGERR